MVNAKRITFNTSVLYLRIIVTSLLSLITVRFVLSALGEENYGIYNVIAGVVAMLNFLNAAMTTSSVRYISIELSHDNTEKLIRTYSTTVILHLLLAFIVSLAILLFKDIFIGSLLKIDSERLEVSKIVYYSMIISTFFTIISVPFDALTNSHEDLFIFSIFDIISAGAKLGIAFVIKYSAIDKLVFYALLMMLIPVVIFLAKFVWVRLRYSKVKFRIHSFDKSLSKDMFFFSGWGMIGAVSGILKNQGVSVVLNIFFGAIANAAFAITVQINSLVNYFSQTLLKAINPSVIKSYGRGDIQQMNYMVKLTSIISYLLLSIIIIPLVLNIDSILHIWLKSVPKYTAEFTIVFLVTSLFVQLSIGLILGFQATGRVKTYQIMVSGLSIVSLPICYCIYYFGGNATSGMIIILLIEFIVSILRVILAQKFYSLNAKDYFKTLFVKCIFISLFIYFTAYFLKYFVIHVDNIMIIFLIFLISLILHCLLFYFIVFNPLERGKIDKVLKRSITVFKS